MIIRINNSNLLNLIESSKQKYKNDTAVLEIVEIHLSKEQTLYEQVHSEYKYESVKETWKEDSGFHVTPIQIELAKNNTYQYVPILKTISALFKHEQLSEIFFKSVSKKQQINIPDHLKIIKSFNDSLVFKDNRLFQKEPQAIQLVTYTDGFDSAHLCPTAKKSRFYDFTILRFDF